MIKIHPTLKNQFRTFLRQYHLQITNPRLQNEIDYIDKTVAAFQNINITTETQKLRTRSAKIHQTPLATFIPCTAAFNKPKIDKEIADILLVYKHFTKNILDVHRASLIQAKFSRNKKRISWNNIDSGQFCLLATWPTFQITSPLRFLRQYTLLPRNRTWSMYGLVGPKIVYLPIFYSSERMLIERGAFPLGKYFTFRANPTVFDYSNSFFMLFVLGCIGENLLTNSQILQFIIDLYIIAGLKPDPPGDYEEVTETQIKKRSFGIIEIIIEDEYENNLYFLQ